MNVSILSSLATTMSTRLNISTSVTTGIWWTGLNTTYNNSHMTTQATTEAFNPFGEPPYIYKVAQMVWFILISIVGTPGNILTLIVLIREKMYRTPSVVYIMSMTMSDTINCLVIAPAASQTVRWGPDAFSSALCYFFGTVNVFCNSCSHIHILAISFDRFIAVTFPLKYRQLFTTRKTIIICAGLWLFVLLIFPIMVNAIGGTFIFLPAERVCTCNWAQPPWFALFMLAVIYATPIVLSILFYMIAVCRVYRQSRQIHAASTSINSREAKKTSAALRLTKLAGAIMGVYLLMWFPWSVCTAYLFTGAILEAKIITLTVCFGASNACINNLVYCGMNERVRRGYKKMFSACGLQRYFRCCVLEGSGDPHSVTFVTAAGPN